MKPAIIVDTNVAVVANEHAWKSYPVNPVHIVPHKEEFRD